MSSILYSIDRWAHQATQLARRIARVEHGLLAWIFAIVIVGIWAYVLWVFLPGLWALAVLLVLFGGLYSLFKGLFDFLLGRRP